MKFKDVKIGMKLRLVTQQIGDHIDYNDNGWKIGDILIVKPQLDLKNLRTGESNYCLPAGEVYNEEGHEYAEFFEPVISSLKEFINGN